MYSTIPSTLAVAGLAVCVRKAEQGGKIDYRRWPRSSEVAPAYDHVGGVALLRHLRRHAVRTPAAPVCVSCQSAQLCLLAARAVCQPPARRSAAAARIHRQRHAGGGGGGHRRAVSSGRARGGSLTTSPAAPRSGARSGTAACRAEGSRPAQADRQRTRSLVSARNPPHPTPFCV
jgi:hypothetical protein